MPSLHELPDLGTRHHAAAHMNARDYFHQEPELVAKPFQKFHVAGMLGAEAEVLAHQNTGRANTSTRMLRTNSSGVKLANCRSKGSTNTLLDAFGLHVWPALLVVLRSLGARSGATT